MLSEEMLEVLDMLCVLDSSSFFQSQAMAESSKLDSVS
jgi:hypothetical protein